MQDVTEEYFEIATGIDISGSINCLKYAVFSLPEHIWS